jgi:hypothetical protein
MHVHGSVSITDGSSISMGGPLPAGTNTIGKVNLTGTPEGDVATVDGASDNQGAEFIGLQVNARLQALGPNGTTFDRLRVDADKNLLIGLKALPTVGAQANAWNNVAVLADGVSNGVDCQYVSNVVCYGTSSADSVIEFQVSMDNTNWYKTSNTINVGAGGDFYTSLSNFGGRYVRVSSTAAATITATIAGQ